MEIYRMKIIQNIPRMSICSIAFGLMALTTFIASAMEYNDQPVAHNFKTLLKTINENRANNHCFDPSFINMRYSFHFAKELALGTDRLHTTSPLRRIRPLLYQGQEIGAIKYADAGTKRYIYNFDINDEKHRGKFRGSWYLEQFIKESRYEGITSIELMALVPRIPFYKRIGFWQKAPDSSHMKLILDPRRYKPTLQILHSPQFPTKSDIILQALHNCNNPEVVQRFYAYDCDLYQEYLYDGYTNHARHYPLHDHDQETEKKLALQTEFEGGYYDLYHQ